MYTLFSSSCSLKYVLHILIQSVRSMYSVSNTERMYTLYSMLYPLNFVFCPLYSMIYMTHYVCYLIYFIIYTLRSILCTQLMYSLSCIVKYTFNSLHYIPCFLHFVLYPLSSTRYTPYSILCTFMSMVYALHYILYT